MPAHDPLHIADNGPSTPDGYRHIGDMDSISPAYPSPTLALPGKRGIRCRQTPRFRETRVDQGYLALVSG